MAYKGSTESDQKTLPNTELMSLESIRRGLGIDSMKTSQGAEDNVTGVNVNLQLGGSTSGGGSSHEYDESIKRVKNKDTKSRNREAIDSGYRSRTSDEIKSWRQSQFELDEFRDRETPIPEEKEEPCLHIDDHSCSETMVKKLYVSAEGRSMGETDAIEDSQSESDSDLQERQSAFTLLSETPGQESLSSGEYQPANWIPLETLKADEATGYDDPRNPFEETKMETKGDKPAPKTENQPICIHYHGPVVFQGPNYHFKACDMRKKIKGEMAGKCKTKKTTSKDGYSTI